MLNRYASWLTVVDNITTNQTNFDLSAHIVNLAQRRFAWNPAAGKKLRAIITINPGVIISSQNTSLPALTVPQSVFRPYDLIVLINKGIIAGASGAPGTGVVGGDICSQPIINGSDGSDGGTALRLFRKVVVNNSGGIYGGGGGGGGGGGHIYKTHIPPGTGEGFSIKCDPKKWYINCTTHFEHECCGAQNWTQCDDTDNCPEQNKFLTMTVDTACCTIKSYQYETDTCWETGGEVNDPWTCKKNDNKQGEKNRADCNVKHEVAKCHWEWISCSQASGGTGGRGRGYANNNGTIIQLESSNAATVFDPNAPYRKTPGFQSQDAEIQATYDRMPNTDVVFLMWSNVITFAGSEAKATALYEAGGLLNAGESTADGRGIGGRGGDWGLNGDRGGDGSTPATGNTSTKRINAGTGGEGGLAGYWIHGKDFLMSYSGNGLRLGREI